MNKIVFFFIVAIMIFQFLFIASCKKEKASCSDGIINQDETGIDCGGSCSSCVSCFDGIKNQSETGVDCGGPCTACPSCTDGMRNQGETGVDCGGPCTSCFTKHLTANIDGSPFTAGLVAGSANDSLIKFQSDQSQTRQMFFEVPLNVTPGTYNIMTAPLFKVTYTDLYKAYVTYQGTILISANNTSAKQLAGTFSFMVWEDNGFGYPVDTLAITNGDFATDY